MAKVILTGYMGSGKTAVGNELSSLLNMPHLDLDNFVEQHENLKITEIFKSKGEIYFRKLEHRLLKQLLEREDDFILSLGGGTPCYSNNHLLLKEPGTVTFFLKSTIDTLMHRLSEEIGSRPLLKDIRPGDLREYIAKHLFDRNPFYNLADHIIVTDGKSPENISREIVALL